MTTTAGLLRELEAIESSDGLHLIDWLQTLLQTGCGDPECPHGSEHSDYLRIARVLNYRTAMPDPNAGTKEKLRSAIEELCFRYEPGQTGSDKLLFELLRLVEILGLPRGARGLSRQLCEHARLDKMKYNGFFLIDDMVVVLPQLVDNWGLIGTWVMRVARTVPTPAAALEAYHTWIMLGTTPDIPAVLDAIVAVLLNGRLPEAEMSGVLRGLGERLEWRITPTMTEHLGDLAPSLTGLTRRKLWLLAAEAGWKQLLDALGPEPDKPSAEDMLDDAMSTTW